MEIVYSEKGHPVLGESYIVGIYGDLLDLLSNVDIYGIEYDDEWSVKRLLNGWRIFYNRQINQVLDLLELDQDLLNKKIKYLSHTDLKFVLLAYLIVNGKQNLIFDYFDYGLSYKDKKRFVKIIRKLKKEGFNITIISKDLFFLNKIVDIIRVFKDNSLVFSGKITEVVQTDYVEKEIIIDFIDKARRMDSSLEFTLEPNELLKDIYRSVV